MCTNDKHGSFTMDETQMRWMSHKSDGWDTHAMDEHSYPLSLFTKRIYLTWKLIYSSHIPIFSFLREPFITAKTFCHKILQLHIYLASINIIIIKTKPWFLSYFHSIVHAYRSKIHEKGYTKCFPSNNKYAHPSHVYLIHHICVSSTANEPC